MRLQRQRLSADDFEPLTIIGRGAFGEVSGGCCCGSKAGGGMLTAVPKSTKHMWHNSFLHDYCPLCCSGCLLFSLAVTKAMYYPLCSPVLPYTSSGADFPTTS